MQEAPPASVITELDYTPPRLKMGAESHSSTMPMTDPPMQHHLFHLQIKPAAQFFF